MDISQAIIINNQRGLCFTGTLEVVDCIDSNYCKIILRKEGLRDTFLSIFPNEIFHEEGFNFFMNSSGKHVTMEIHDLETLKNYVKAMSGMRYLQIYWNTIYNDLKNRHLSN